MGRKIIHGKQQVEGKLQQVHPAVLLLAMPDLWCSPPRHARTPTHKTARTWADEQHGGHVVQPGRQERGGNPAGRAPGQHVSSRLSEGPRLQVGSAANRLPSNASSCCALQPSECLTSSAAASHEQQAEEAHAAAAALDRPGRHQFKQALQGKQARGDTLTPAVHAGAEAI